MLLAVVVVDVVAEDFLMQFAKVLPLRPERGVVASQNHAQNAVEWFTCRNTQQPLLQLLVSLPKTEDYLPVVPRAARNVVRGVGRIDDGKAPGVLIRELSNLVLCQRQIVSL